MGEQVAARFPWGIAQLGEHLPCKQGVKGSNPFISTQQVLLVEICSLENRILKLKSIISSLQNDITRHPRDLAEMQDQTSKTKQNLK